MTLGQRTDVHKGEAVKRQYHRKVLEGLLPIPRCRFQELEAGNVACGHA